MSADWAHLPSDLLGAISQRLLLYSDYVRIRAVCHGWRSAVAAIPRHLPAQPPWLLLPLYQQYHFNTPSSKHFYDPINNSIKRLGHSSATPPELSLHMRRCGSSHGWLIVRDYSPRILLFNPLTNSKVNLPDLTTFPNVIDFSFTNIGKECLIRLRTGACSTSSSEYTRDVFLRKVVLSNSPAMDSGFIALAMFSQSDDLAYCRKGDDCWRFIEGAKSYCEDAIYKDGLFHCINRDGMVAVCDLSGDSPRISYVESRVTRGSDIQYLVSVGEDIVLVTKFLQFGEGEHPMYKTSRFEVFRMDWSSSNPRWMRIDSLGDYALFIGMNSSFSMLAANFPGFVGDKIYYTEDYSEYQGYHSVPDSGIYSLCDGRIERFPCFGQNECLPAPIWLTPNPC